MEEAGKAPSPLSPDMTQVEQADMPPSPLPTGRRQMEEADLPPSPLSSDMRHMQEAEDLLLPLPLCLLSSGKLQAKEAEKGEQEGAWGKIPSTEAIRN